MSFDSPAYLLVLLVVPAALLLALINDRRRARYPIAFTNLDLLASLVNKRRSRARRYLPLALLTLALASAATALAHPEAKLSEPDQNATIVLLVDVSGSMRAADVQPTRLAAAITAMNTFIDRLPSQYKAGLVAFSDTPQTYLSPTQNRVLLRAAVSYLQPEAGTALGDGLAAAVALVKQSLTTAGFVRKPGQYVPGAIVLLSDGAQNRGILQPYQAALEAKKAGIRVYAIAFGTPNGTVTFGGVYTTPIPVPPDPAAMQMIAQTTGGHAYTAQTASGAADIYRTLGSSIGRTTKKEQITSWFAAAAALFLLGAFLIGKMLEPQIP